MMTRQWQTEIVLSTEPERSTLVYGESIADLCANVRQWLLDHRPDLFGNRVNAVVSGETTYYAKRGAEKTTWDRVIDGRPDIIGSFDFVDAVDTFVHYSLMPEPGPDYREILIVNGSLQHQLVRTIRREERADWVNHWLSCGWRLITIETAAGRPAMFVLGHPEKINLTH